MWVTTPSQHITDVQDCPVFPYIDSYATLVAAATSTACRQLLDGSMLSICWDGGRHHAMRDRASGFCYVADIVLGIMLLAKEGTLRPPPTQPVKVRRHRRPRIMYVDLDLHHGDGVAKAFHSPTHYLTGKERPPQVLTLSVHHSSPSFFPAPTPLTPADTSSPFTLVTPLAAYPSTSTYHRVFVECIEPVRKAFDPDYVVLQLGADGLPADPIGQWGSWNADGEGGMAWCAQQVQAWGLPMCVLGGGGYNHPNTARAWSKVTAALVRPTGLTLFFAAADRPHRPVRHYRIVYRITIISANMAPRSRWTLIVVSILYAPAEGSC